MHSIYLHIPFCRTKCTYCAFNTYTNLDDLIEPFVGALIRELQIVGAQKPGLPVGTIFFGGGTPSLLTPAQFERILDTLFSTFAVQPDAEITLEANPSDIHRDYAHALYHMGFNRISLGMQSANQNELDLFNRRHDNNATARAVSAARLGGFNNLNLDLIYGAPHQTLDTWDNTLRQMLALKPDHVSLYALGLEDGTPMAKWVATGRLPTPDDDLAADMYDLTTEQLAAAGYEQYEISNWARPGYACRHNLQYWHNEPYLGFGPGAHGWAGGVRYAVLPSPQRYIKILRDAPLEGWTFPHTPAVEQAVKVDKAGEIAETLIMHMRLTQQGVPRAGFRERFGVDLLDLHGEALRKFAARGLLTIDDERVRLTAEGRLLSNVIFREFV